MQVCVQQAGGLGGPRFCISNEPPEDAEDAGPQTCLSDKAQVLELGFTLQLLENTDATEILI